MKKLLPLIGLLGCAETYAEPPVLSMGTYTEDTQYTREENPSEYLKPEFEFPTPESLDVISGEIVVRDKVKGCMQNCH